MKHLKINCVNYQEGSLPCEDCVDTCSFCDGQCCRDPRGNKVKHTILREYYHHDCDYCEDGKEI